MAHLNTLQDRFDSTIDNSKWTSFHTGTSTIAQTGGMVVATPPNATAGSNYAGYDSVGSYDLTGNYMVLEVPNMVAVATNAQVYAALILDANNKLQFIQQNGSLKAQKIVAGVTTTLVTLTYNSTSHQWWRIRENNGVIFFETATNGAAWAIVASTANPFSVTALSVELAAGTFQSETSPGFANFDNFNFPNTLPNSSTPKTYAYHSYKSGAFQGVLTNVISNFEYQQEINSAGSAITIVLGAAADSFGEGSLIDFNNQIQIYVIDDEVPNGSLIFNGFIVNYKPLFTDDNQEQVVVTVMGYGATLNDYMIEATNIVDASSLTQNTFVQMDYNSKSGAWDQVYQSFKTGVATTKLIALKFKMAAATSYDLGNVILLQICASSSDIESNTAANVLGSASVVLTSTSATDYTFTFGTPLTVTPGTTYYARLSILTPGPNAPTTGNITNYCFVYYDTSAPYTDGSPKTGYYNGVVTTTWTALVGDLYFVSYSTTGLNTTVAYSGTDPSVILKNILDNYAAQGGQITYTAASIDLTNTSVTYQFNTNTVFEGVNAILSLAPVGWYWYVDQATNILHFHALHSSADQTILLGKHIKNIAVEKRVQELVNVVYFIGGPIAGVNLYQKYILQASIDKYGKHALRYTDNNVTLAATAQTIANAIISNRSGPELRIDVDIIDNGGNASSILGMNIESVVLGTTISFRSFGPGSGGTLWDTAFWDISKWDFDITDLSSVVVQITKIDYSPDILHLSLSTTPPDITKRTEYIYRQLVQTQSLSNPSAPS